MSHIDTIEYVWPFDNLPESFFLFWEDHFRFLDPGYDGLPVSIEYTFTPGRPGKFDGKPENCYPTEYPEVEINSMVATVPYSSTGAKANHIDAYPSYGSDALTCAGQREFVTALLNAWEAWLDDRNNERALEVWVLEKACDTEKEMADNAAVDLHESLMMARYGDPDYL